MIKNDWNEVKERMQRSWNQMKIMHILSNMSDAEFDRVIHVVKRKARSAHKKNHA